MFNFILRIMFCSFSFHTGGDKIQSHKKYDIYTCKYCGNLFAIKKSKYKNK